MKVYLEVYGCTANKGDASLIKGVLKEKKYEIVDKIDNADYIIILTCTVIDTTEQRMLSRIKFFKKTDKKIVVAGCMASLQSDVVKSIIPNALFLPPQYSHHINDLLKGEKTIFKEKNKTLFPKYYESVIAPISIAEGCMFSCSYCITSKARGKLRSFPIVEIKNDVYSAIEMGCREIQLTAQDVSSYGLDNGYDLGDLLRNVCSIKDDYRVRVGMMNPFTCLKNIDSILNSYENSKIYKFLHLPVQSGNDDILSIMNRKYSVDDFLKILKRFRDKFYDITLSTDIIVGFPTETEEQFQNTIDLIKNVKPDITNITRFSARPFTKAKDMKGRVRTDIVKKRSKKLTDICSKLSEEKNLKHIGKKYKILITERGKNNTFVGRNNNYKPVVIKEKVDIGDFISVKINDAASTYLVGSII